MSQVGNLEQLLHDVETGSDEAVIAAAKDLLGLGEFGSPTGSYPLRAAKAAMRQGHLADAVILLHHGLRVAEPNTTVWADLLVNRASACALHGFYRDAIEAGEAFLQVQDSLPAETAEFVPYAHHAVGFAYDKFRDYDRAVTHYRLAVELRDDPYWRAVSSSDLAYALVMAGRLDEADLILAQGADSTDTFPNFVKACTTSLIRYHQHRFDEAVSSAERAYALAAGKEELWASPLAELRYWHSRAAWELGNRHQAAALALRAALSAEELRLIDLRDKANDWLAEILYKGGIHSA